jgi:isopropylmalate/homocitrate/citramalate synthase
MPLKKLGIHWYMTDDEVIALRKQLDGMRASGNYNPGKWFLSGFNRKPEVLGAALPDHMPKKVVLKDITLRTAEQTPGIILNPEERLRLLRASLEVGVTSFQTTYGLHRHSAEQLRSEIEFIKSIRPDASVEIVGAHSKEAIDQMIALGANTASLQGPANFGISAFYGVSETAKMAWEGKDWRTLVKPPKSMEELIERNKPLIDYAKKRGVKIKASLNMLHYATEEHIDRFSREMANAGADYIALHDGPGGMGPQAIGYAVTIAKKAAPDVKIAMHLHDTFGLAVAVNIAAVQAGAELLEVAINGYCCAAGQTDLAQIAAALEIMYGVETGIKLDKLTDLRRLGEEITGIRVAGNHPVTGENYFVWSGNNGVAMEGLVDPLIHWCVDASVFGNKGDWLIDQTSGYWSIAEKLDQLGIEVEKEEVETILKRVQAKLLEHKRTLSDEEIRAIAMQVKAAA